jgi:signal peptidase I
MTAVTPESLPAQPEPALQPEPAPQEELPLAPVAPARPALTEWIITVILLLFGTTTLLQAFVIPTGSMEDSLLIGDHLLVDKLAYAPSGPVSRFLLPYTPVRRGDIVVFRYPADVRQTFVKRVIGVPGDRIRIVNKEVLLNGRRLEEPYKVHKTSYVDSYRDNFPSEPNTRIDARAQEMLSRNVENGEVTVPPGCYFVLGDNRDSSLDSRYWGFVPRDNIIGKPLLIYWSYDAPTHRLAGPGFQLEHWKDLAANFVSKTRWRRTFLLIRGHAIEP